MAGKEVEWFFSRAESMYLWHVKLWVAVQEAFSPLMLNLSAFPALHTGGNRKPELPTIPAAQISFQVIAFTHVTKQNKCLQKKIFSNRNDNLQLFFFFSKL